MRKIALPVKGNELSPHFGESPDFKFYYEENGAIIKEEIIAAPKLPESIPNWLVEMGVTDVIAFGIGLTAIEILSRNKVNVFVGVKVKGLNDLMKDFLNGTLETNGNLCDH